MDTEEGNGRTFQESCYNSVKCRLCDKIVVKGYRLRRHIEECHSEDKLYKCDPCKKSFKRHEKFERHKKSALCVNMHIAKLSHPCPFCGKKFSTVHEIYETHLRKGRCPKKYRCAVCPDHPFFEKKIGLEVHNNMNHSVTVSPKLTIPNNSNQRVLVKISLPSVQNSVSTEVRNVQLQIPEFTLVRGSISDASLQSIITESIEEAQRNFLTTHHTVSFVQSKIDMAFPK